MSAGAFAQTLYSYYGSNSTTKREGSQHVATLEAVVQSRHDDFERLMEKGALLAQGGAAAALGAPRERGCAILRSPEEVPTDWCERGHPVVTFRSGQELLKLVESETSETVPSLSR
jgi:hypothetical protein